MAAYIKFDGIDGDVVADGYMKWIELLSFSWGATQAGSSQMGGGGGAGKVQFQDFHFSSISSQASPRLAESVCQGKVFPKVEIHVVTDNADGRRGIFLKYELTNVVVSGYQMGRTGDELPVDSLDLRLGAALVTVGEVSGVVGACGRAGR